MERSPQLEDGYIRYAHELDAALAYADFTKGARIVLREVFAQMFGPADRRTVKLSPTELGKLFEVNKGFFGRAIRELTDSNVLEKLGECEYRFVKDYGRWTKNGHRRLSETEMKLAARGTKMAMRYKFPWVVNPVNEDRSEQQSLNFGSADEMESDPGVQSSKRPGCNPGNRQESEGAIQATERCQSSKRPGCNPVNGVHYIEPARSEKNEKLETERVPAPATTDLGPEYTDVGNKAIQLGADVGWGAWVINMGRLGYPARWIGDVVEKMAARGHMDGSIGHGILKRYAKQDGTDDDVRPKMPRRSGPVPSIPVDNSHRYVRAPKEYTHPSRRKDES
jgi:hypothetical protein